MKLRRRNRMTHEQRNQIANRRFFEQLRAIEKAYKRAAISFHKLGSAVSNFAAAAKRIKKG